MQNKFKEFYINNENIITTLTDSLLIFDTNVLLNIYRYKKETSDYFFKIIEKKKDDIWLPYHVALEFNRNRKTVIDSQNNYYSEVKKIISKGIRTLSSELEKLGLDKRHSDIKISDFTNELKKIESTYFENLLTLKEQSITINNDSYINLFLEYFNDEKIGDKPTQDIILKIQSDAKIRYKKKIPPGYMDESKTDCFTYDNIIYSSKYSDYIIWRQILDYLNKGQYKNVLFITDDIKEDWWSNCKQNSKRYPRVELLNEAITEGNLDNFNILTTLEFIEFSSTLLDVELKESTLNDIKFNSFNEIDYELLYLGILNNWVKNNYEYYNLVNEVYLDIVADSVTGINIFGFRSTISTIDLEYDVPTTIEEAKKNSLTKIVMIYLINDYNVNQCKDIANFLESQNFDIEVIICDKNLTVLNNSLKILNKISNNIIKTD